MRSGLTVLNRLKGYLFFTLFMPVVSPVSAQCSFSSGLQIVNETFGSGPNNIGPQLTAGITNFDYSPTICPKDGQYAIVHTTSGCFTNAWHTVTDHTGDANGYYMVVNASKQPSVFFTQTINGLCSGTTYQFASWVVNMDSTVQPILPNITFAVQTIAGDILASYSTGDIPITTQTTWKQYGLLFQTPPGVTSVILTMRNNAPGGNGNDLGIDDITFSPASPQIEITCPGSKNDTLINYFCYQKRIGLSSVVGDCYTQNAFQWQTSNDGVTWNDIPGVTGTVCDFIVQNPGTQLFRLEVARVGNMENLNCRTSSAPFTVISQSADCPVFKIPNTFTPNGDGINDTWNMDFLQYFPGCLVRVYTRAGQQIFKSANYGKPWDGTYNGKRLPKGTYYYIIDLNNASPPLSGYIMIIR